MASNRHSLVLLLWLPLFLFLASLASASSSSPRALEAPHFHFRRSSQLHRGGRKRQATTAVKLGLISQNTDQLNAQGTDMSRTTTKTQTALGVLTQVCLTPVANGNSTTGQVCTLSLESNGIGQGGAPSAPAAGGIAVVTVVDATVTVLSTAAGAAAPTAPAATSSTPASSSAPAPNAPVASSALQVAATPASSAPPAPAASSAPTEENVASQSPAVSTSSAASTTAPAGAVASSSVVASSTVSSPGAIASAAAASAAPFVLPGTQLQVLPIGLGVFAGVSVIALIVVALVTYERRKYRANFRARRAQEVRA